MKHLKLFNESRRDEFLNLGWKSAKIGDIQPEDIIYQYVQELHNYDDFINGDLGERIEEYSSYKLQLIKIDEKLADIEWYIDDDIANSYAEIINETNDYPPIVIGKDMSIIDGSHRMKAIINSGRENILAWVGRK